jgi:hypothetical protein
MMRTKLWLLLLLFSSSAMAQDVALSPKDLVGTWRYYKKIYAGQVIPELPDATLRLFFSFYADGTDRLIWTHENQWDWCERSGVYSVEKNFLLDEVTWVNPRNSRECARDPDMQPGRKAITPISISAEGDLEIHLFIGDEPLIMVWKKLGG